MEKIELERVFTGKELHYRLIIVRHGECVVFGWRIKNAALLLPPRETIALQTLQVAVGLLSLSN